MEEPTITPEQVMAAGVKHYNAACRIATYANLRAAGHRKIDAGQGVDAWTCSRYEKWANTVRDGLGLPPLPRAKGISNWSGEVERANHNRWHVLRGVSVSGCPLCEDEAS